MTLRYPSQLSVNHGPVAPRNFHLLLIIILTCFGGSYLAGRNESTPARVSTVTQKIANIVLGQASEKSAAELLGLVTKSRSSLEEQLLKEYGEFYGRIFDPVMLEHIFLAGDDSKDRLRRRIVTKVVRNLLRKSHSDKDDPVQFVWATAGDSSAAGHGNMQDQSYTAILEDTVSDAFSSVGIQFVTRNYGMSWYGSGIELALCMEAIYGSDLDVLHWDFSAMDEGEQKVDRLSVWGERASMHPARPILFMLDSKVSNPDRYELFSCLEEQGSATVFVDKAAINTLRTRIPGDADRNVLPPALDNFMCNGAVEGNVPCDDPIRFFTCDQDGAESCADNKYNTEKGCDYEAYQKSWHPGWKEHLLRGRLLGHFMLKTLEEALLLFDKIQNPQGTSTTLDAKTILEILERKAVTEVDAFHNSPLRVHYSYMENATMVQMKTLFRSNAVCHTALLPSETRYSGIVTGTLNRGDSNGGYDKGVDKVILAISRREDGILPLAFEPTDRQRCATLKIDHKDFFYIREGDGWLSTVVPNQVEIQAYRRVHKAEGYIMICLKPCPLGRCSDDYIGFGESAKGRNQIELMVDGDLVTGVHYIDGCHLLENENGLRWGPGKKAHGQYKIQFRLNIPKQVIEKELKISSIIVF